MSKRKTRAKPRPKARRRGMPKPASVVEAIPFVSKGGAKFTILRTTEKDSYDPPLKRKKPRESE
jgi:hypothetical protein